jgi:type II secretory pathway pseudopilin PulG
VRRSWKRWSCMSRNNRKRKLRAFTIPEMLLGFIICAMAVAAAATTYVMISQAWRENLVVNELSRSANVAIGRMIHGRPGNAGLVAAQYILSPIPGTSANSVDYTDAFDDLRRFYFSGSKIYTESGDSIISDVDSVTFSNIDRTIQIELALHKYVRSKEVKLYIKTLVGPRN